MLKVHLFCRILYVSQPFIIVTILTIWIPVVKAEDLFKGDDFKWFEYHADNVVTLSLEQASTSPCWDSTDIVKTLWYDVCLLCLQSPKTQIPYSRHFIPSTLPLCSRISIWRCWSLLLISSSAGDSRLTDRNKSIEKTLVSDRTQAETI